VILLTTDLPPSLFFQLASIPFLAVLFSPVRALPFHFPLLPIFFRFFDPKGRVPPLSYPWGVFFLPRSGGSLRYPDTVLYFPPALQANRSMSYRDLDGGVLGLEKDLSPFFPPDCPPPFLFFLASQFFSLKFLFHFVGLTHFFGYFTPARSYFFLVAVLQISPPPFSPCKSLLP